MIEAKNLTKSFNNRNAVSNVDFEIDEGEILGVIGVDGAGRSTLLRIISGVIQPDEGEILFDGHSLKECPEIKEDIFFLPEELYFPTGQSVYGLAKFYSMFYEKFDLSFFRSLCEEFEIKLKLKMNSLSTSMKRQVMLLVAASLKPRFLVLDEFFDGTDTIANETLKNILKKFCEQYKTTVVISSNNIKEIEDVCGQVLFLYESKVIVGGKISELEIDGTPGNSLEDMLKNELEVQGYVARDIDFI